MQRNPKKETIFFINMTTMTTIALNFGHIDQMIMNKNDVDLITLSTESEFQLVFLDDSDIIDKIRERDEEKGKSTSKNPQFLFFQLKIFIRE